LTVGNQEQLAFGGARGTSTSQLQPTALGLPLASSSVSTHPEPGSNAFSPSMASTLFLPSNASMAQQPFHVQPIHVQSPNVFPQTASTYQSPPFHQHTPTPWHNTNPFTLMNINGRIKKCAGCRREFADSLGPVFVGLVVQHIERDFYPDKNGIRRIGSEQARYYHPEQACIKARHPYFQPTLLQLHATLSIDDLQAHYLRHHFGIDIGPTGH